MKLLLLHADYIEWEPKKKAVSVAEEIEKKPKKVEEALVVLTAVESEDEANPKCVEEAVKEIESVFNQVHAKNIVLYPYAHLSSDLAKPSEGLKILRKMEGLLKEDGYSVYRSPFGWYKAFTLKVKGHPLSELSKKVSFKEKAIEIGKKEEVSEALKKEKTLRSEWFIIEPSGNLYPIQIKDNKLQGYDFSKYPKLEKLTRYEISKSRIVDKEPPHIRLMKKLELVDYEPGSDPGNLKYYPKGRLIKSLIEEWVTRKTIEYGAMEVETPIMYDMEHPVLKNYLNRFPARQYIIKTPNKDVFLRFSACFGQFLMAKNTNISYRNLPLRIYELTRYSFRVEQRGELAGLRRLRAFTMPDCHALVRDMQQAKEEVFRRFELAKSIMEGLSLGKEDFELAIRAVKDFLEEHKDFIINLVKKWGKPALLEVWNEKFFYFVFKYEWNFIDALDKAAALTTDQIDVENAERYGITYMDKDNKKKYPLILHLSPSGAIERVMYALLEKAWMELEKKKNPVLPLWLSPVQVRFCPVSDEYLEYAQRLVDETANQNIRVDLDDRVESVSKKIRDAEIEWIPYIVVVGKKEKESGKLAVRIRETGEVKEMGLQELITEIKAKTEGFPFKPLPLPRELSKRPIFVG